MSVVSAIILLTTNERKQMTNSTLEVGQTYTTTTSNVVGIIKAIDNHPSGVSRILLDVEGKERWTSLTN
jgi:hypothetical protein